MFLNIDIWLLPAISAGASSYLICLIWERYRHESAPNGTLAGLLVCLSFIMGALSACYRQNYNDASLEGNIIVMFTAGATATFFWLLLRKYMIPGRRNGNR
jgi:glucan phosphoethanolaminetransferase (alkaline phosphatase superfamily)